MGTGIGGEGLSGGGGGSSLLPELARAEGLFGLLADPELYAARIADLRAEVLRCERAKAELDIAGDAVVARNAARAALEEARGVLAKAETDAAAIRAAAESKRKSAAREDESRRSDLDAAAQGLDARDSAFRVREADLAQRIARFERTRDAHMSDHSACETFFAARRDAVRALDAAVRTFLKHA